jgi:hypothetical protein
MPLLRILAGSRAAARLVPLGLALFAVGAAAQPVVAGYTTQQRHGFQVLTLDAGVAAQPALMQSAVAELDAQLAAIDALPDLPPDALAALRAVKIFVDLNQTSGGAVYHPSRAWLVQNGYIPEKERSVEISNAANFAAWSRQNQPWLVLHELAHAYHHQVLGYAHAGTTAAYEHALGAGLLASVLYNPGGGGAPFPRPAYAATNATEYFPEVSEAFFGENDFYPFVRADLAAYDAQGHALMRDAWQVGGSTNAEPAPEAAPLRAFPNPARGVLRLSGPARVQRAEVYDVLGRRLAAPFDGEALDVRGLAPGAYFVRAEVEGRARALPFLVAR